MTVVKFPRAMQALEGWKSVELQQLLSMSSSAIATGEAGSSPILLAEQAVATLRRRKMAIVARVAVAWSAVREFFEERTEAMLGEPVELLAHIAPQLAPLA